MSEHESFFSDDPETGYMSFGCRFFYYGSLLVMIYATAPNLWGVPKRDPNFGKRIQVMVYDVLPIIRTLDTRA